MAPRHSAAARPPPVARADARSGSAAAYPRGRPTPAPPIPRLRLPAARGGAARGAPALPDEVLRRAGQGRPPLAGGGRELQPLAHDPAVPARVEAVALAGGDQRVHA